MHPVLYCGTGASLAGATLGFATSTGYTATMVEYAQPVRVLFPPSSPSRPHLPVPTHLR